MKIRRKLFSKLEDQDYIEESENRKKNATVKKIKRTVKGTLGGATAGALTGLAIGSQMQRHGGKFLSGATATGTLIGAGAGYLSGKHHEKKVHEKEDKNIATYKKASEHDKKYLRDKRYKEDMMKIEKEKLKEQKKQTAAARQTAWNTSPRYYSIHRGGGFRS